MAKTGDIFGFQRIKKLISFDTVILMAILIWSVVKFEKFMT